MVFKGYTRSLYVLLAIAVILLAGHTHGAGLCDNAPNKQVCDSIVYQRTNPREAVVASIHKMVYQTKVAKAVAQKQANSTKIDACIKEFKEGIDNGKRALEALAKSKYISVRTSIIAAWTNCVVCDNGFGGDPNPIAKSTKLVEDIAAAGVYLTNLI
uniref:Pectinesterase inhibitor domain-containing protein n=1 Tax=Quercus lobata TaxID=97700 RepID=A0A7N2LKZ0_QUELO